MYSIGFSCSSFADKGGKPLWPSGIIKSPVKSVPLKVAGNHRDEGNIAQALGSPLIQSPVLWQSVEIQLEAVNFKEPMACGSGRPSLMFRRTIITGSCQLMYGNLYYRLGIPNLLHFYMGYYFKCHSNSSFTDKI